MLGEIHERAGVGNQTRTNQLADHDGQIGSNGVHAVFKVIKQLLSVVVEGHNLLAQVLDVEQIFVANLRAH